MKNSYLSKLIILAIILSGCCLSSFAQTTTYTIPGGPYAYTVPAGVAGITVNVTGAVGGLNSDELDYPDRGGYGGCVQAVIAVTPGQVLQVYVGGQGGNGTSAAGGIGGINGGSPGSNGLGAYSGGGGGGASDVRDGSGNRLVVGAGGGGAGEDCSLVDADRGGDGGFNMPSGGDGAGCGTTTGGGGGTNGFGGIGGVCSSCLGVAGMPGNAFAGGIGGAGSAGGGGGGGYNGGGGGQWSGGGGGANYYLGTGVTLVTDGGSCNTLGNGSVTVTPLCTTPVAGTITGGFEICQGTYTALSDFTATPGGIWSSSNPAIATIDGTGYVTAVSAGSTLISYTVNNGICGSITDTATLVVDPLPFAYNVIGGGSYCAGGAGLDVALDGSDPGINYQLYNGASIVGGMIAGTGSPIDFGFQMAGGSYMVYATNAATSCTSIMAGSATIIVNPLPFADTVTGGGAYCAGGTGVDVSLNNSDPWISYQLYNGSIAVGAPIDGTGTALDFGLQTAAGTYSVVAADTAALCTNNMAGSATISINPLPDTDTVMGGGNYCSGGAGVDVMLNMSDTGVNYQLYAGIGITGAPVAGTGSPLDFGLQTGPGTYTVVAVNSSTGCTNNMAGSAMVSINPLPDAYAVNGGGSYCPGGIGVHVGLGGSDTGISYQLYNGAAIVGSLLTGTGAPLDFGLQTAAGTYAVVATNTTTACVGNMSGSAVVAINPLPATYIVTGGGSYCAGGAGFDIMLSGSDAGISYQLFAAGSATGSAMPGTGSPIDFGFQATGGSYTVVATNTVTTCNTNMAGSATIVVNALPAAYIVTGGGGYCAGGAGANVGLNGSQSGVKYQLFMGAAAVSAQIAGTGAALGFGLQTAVGAYTAIAVDTTTACTSNMGGSAVVSIIPVVVPALSVSINTSDTICAGTVTTFTADTTNAGPTPFYQWTINGVLSGTDNIAYGYAPANGDVVGVAMISSAVCAIPDTVFSSYTMNVLPNDSPSLSLSLNPGDTVCKGTAVTFTPVPSFGGTAPAYTWIRNSVPVSTGASYSYVPVDGDLVFVEMASNYPCRLANTAYSNIHMTVDSPIVPAVSIASFPGTTIAPGRPDTLVATVTNGGSAPAYQWFLNSSPVTSATSGVFVATHYVNNDSVTVIVTRNDVCALSTVNSIVFTVTNVGVATVGLSGADVAILPNPNKGAFTIKGSIGTVSDEAVSIEVTDMIGQVVYSNKVMPVNGIINEQVQLGGRLANGSYILSLRSASGNNTFRFVVEQ